MTKDGTKQKAEMTPEEFSERHGVVRIELYLDEDDNQIKGRPIIKSGFLSDLTSVIRGKLVEFLESMFFTNKNASKIVDEFLKDNQ